MILVYDCIGFAGDAGCLSYLHQMMRNGPISNNSMHWPVRHATWVSMIVAKLYRRISIKLPDRIDLFTHRVCICFFLMSFEFARIISHIVFLLSLSEDWNQIIVTVVQTKPVLINSTELWIWNFSWYYSQVQCVFLMILRVKNVFHKIILTAVNVFHFVSCPRNLDKHITHVIS